MSDVVLIWFLALVTVVGTATVIKNRDLIQGKKTDGWEICKPTLQVEWEDSKKKMSFYYRKESPDGSVVHLKNEFNKPYRFIKKRLEEPAKEASLGGNPDFIHLVYRRERDTPVSESILMAKRMQVKTMEKELQDNSSSMSKRLYDENKTFEAARKWTGYGGGYGGEYDRYRQPLSGLGEFYNPRGSVRPVEEQGGETE